MSFTPRRAETTITYLGTAFTLVFDMETVARYEMATSRSFLEDVAALAQTNEKPDQDGGQIAPPAKPLQLTRLGELLLAALGEYHPELTRSHAMQMVLSPEVSEAFGNTLAGGMPQPGDVAPEAGGAAAGNRQQRRAAKPARSGGKTGTSSR